MVKGNRSSQEKPLSIWMDIMWTNDGIVFCKRIFYRWISLIFNATMCFSGPCRLPAVLTPPVSLRPEKCNYFPKPKPTANDAGEVDVSRSRHGRIFFHRTLRVLRLCASQYFKSHTNSIPPMSNSNNLLGVQAVYQISVRPSVCRSYRASPHT